MGFNVRMKQHMHAVTSLCVSILRLPLPPKTPPSPRWSYQLEFKVESSRFLKLLCEKKLLLWEAEMFFARQARFNFCYGNVLYRMNSSISYLQAKWAWGGQMWHHSSATLYTFTKTVLASGILQHICKVSLKKLFIQNTGSAVEKLPTFSNYECCVDTHTGRYEYIYTRNHVWDELVNNDVSCIGL